MARRPSLALAALAISAVIGMLLLFNSGSSTYMTPYSGQSTSVSDIDVSGVVHSEGTIPHKDLTSGKPIMAKMTNETVKAELGRAAWKVFHTILAQYPEKPSPEDRQTLSSYIHLFSRVYPCRECAEHFQELLSRYPPQTSTREGAAQWGCHVHNQVNKRLGKEEFDCMELSDKYACGCGEDDVEAETVLDSEHPGPHAFQRGG